MSTQHALTKFVGPIKVAGVEGSGCLGHHRAPVRIHGSGGRSRRHGCLEQPPCTGWLHDPQGSVSGGGGMNGPTELLDVGDSGAFTAFTPARGKRGLGRVYGWAASPPNFSRFYPYPPTMPERKAKGMGC